MFDHQSGMAGSAARLPSGVGAGGAAGAAVAGGAIGAARVARSEPRSADALGKFETSVGGILTCIAMPSPARTKRFLALRGSGMRASRHSLMSAALRTSEVKGNSRGLAASLIMTLSMPAILSPTSVIRSDKDLAMSRQHAVMAHHVGHGVRDLFDRECDLAMFRGHGR